MYINAAQFFIFSFCCWFVIDQSYKAAKHFYFEKKSSFQRWLGWLLYQVGIYFISGFSSYLLFNKNNYEFTISFFLIIAVPFTLGWLKSVSIDNEFLYEIARPETVIKLDEKEYKLKYARGTQNEDIIYKGVIYDMVEVPYDIIFHTTGLAKTIHFRYKITKEGSKDVEFGSSPDRFVDKNLYNSAYQIIDKIKNAVDANEMDLFSSKYKSLYFI